MLKDNEISMDRMRTILHISKRKAAWMLRTGVIPCRIRDTRTHRYAVRIEDVEEYLNRSYTERRDEIPAGLFSSQGIGRTAKSPELMITVRGEEQDRYIGFLESRLRKEPDRLTVGQTAGITGYTYTTVERFIQEGTLFALRIGGQYSIPKTQLIAFLASSRAFAIRTKTEWHANIIASFLKEEEKQMKDSAKKTYYEIGSRIRKARQEARISQEDLATAADISDAYVSDIEAGRRNFSVDMLLGISDALSVSCDWLLRGDAVGPERYILPQSNTKNELSSVLDGLTEDELHDILQLVTDLKRTLKRSKSREE